MSDILFGNATNWAGNPHNPGAADHIGSVIAALGTGQPPVRTCATWGGIKCFRNSSTAIPN